MRRFVGNHCMLCAERGDKIMDHCEKGMLQITKKQEHVNHLKNYCSRLQKAMESATLQSGEHMLLRTGLAIACPSGTYARIAPSSGLALKHNISSGAGVVDADYRNEIIIRATAHGAHRRRTNQCEAAHTNEKFLDPPNL